MGRGEPSPSLRPSRNSFRSSSTESLALPTTRMPKSPVRARRSPLPALRARVGLRKLSDTGSRVLPGAPRMTGNHGHSERRAAPRRGQNQRVTYRPLRDGIAGVKAVATETIDLSATGLCLRTKQPLERDTHLALELTLRGQGQPVLAMGRVVWCAAEPAGYRVGVSFVWLRTEDLEALSAIARYLHSAGGP
ncbi:MAG: PilZ domain-containing protein [Planctomycetaceae bacterium]